MDINTRHARNASTVNLLAGLWLLLTPYFMDYASTGLLVNSIVIGLIIAILAFIIVMMPSKAGWLSSINILAGIWLIITPFALGYINMAPLWDSIIVGLIVVIAGSWSSAESSYMLHARARA